MPSIITHDYFGREFLSRSGLSSKWSKSQQEAYLLGNQGPDPFFYAVATPRFFHYLNIGSIIHDEKPTQFFSTLLKCANELSTKEKATIQPYLLGFIQHYVLDSTVHPLVYFYEYSITKSEIYGLSDKDHSEIHSTIESEFDELVLYAKRGLTVKEFRPYQDILKANKSTLDTVSKFFVDPIYECFERTIPYDLFAKSVQNFRLIQRIFYSPLGIKRKVLSTIEKRFRNHSFYSSMSHLSIKRTYCSFANEERKEWINPFFGSIHTESFWDLFEQAQQKALIVFEILPLITTDPDKISLITDGLNNSGKQVE